MDGLTSLDVDEREQTARLLVSCPDRHGIVVAVAGFLADRDARLKGLQERRAELERALGDGVAKPLEMSWRFADALNVAFVSRQLGHANPTITLGVYAHLFAQADHAEAARAALDAEPRRDGGRTRIVNRGSPRTAVAVVTAVVTGTPRCGSPTG